MRPGTVLADKYRIERVLGKGGMGVVLAASHIQLGTKVALKFLHEDMAQHPTVVERFLREARASAQLRGEHICRVSDVGTVDGAPYIVMELLDGIDLAKLLAREGRLPVRRACDYVLQACAGVAEAHGAGIVHRDLKPANLFLTRRTDGSELVKVLDFGIAKAPPSKDFSLTQTTTVLGSPGYMSPEQLRSSKLVDARADVWALGAILYELMSGRKPFVADSLTELALKIAMDPTPPLPGARPDLDLVVGRCLEKDPANRYPNVGELAEALAPFATPESRSAAGVVRGVLTRASEELMPATEQMAVVESPTIADASATSAKTSAVENPTTLGRATGELGAAPRRRATWSLPVVLGLVIAGGLGIGAFVMNRPARRGQPAAAPVAAPIVDPASVRASPPADAAAPVAVDAPPLLAAPADAAPPDAAQPPARHLPHPGPRHDRPMHTAGSASTDEDFGAQRQ